jgi:transposase
MSGRDKTPSRERLVELRFEKAMTREDIADHFDVSIATVRRWIKDMYVPRPNRRTRPKRPKHLTASGEIVAKVDDGYNNMERAHIILQGRLVSRAGFGYYLDGKPAHIDDILAAAGL